MNLPDLKICIFHIREFLCNRLEAGNKGFPWSGEIEAGFPKAAAPAAVTLDGLDDGGTITCKGCGWSMAEGQGYRPS